MSDIIIVAGNIARRNQDNIFTEINTFDSEIDWSGGNVTYVPLTGNIQTYINNATDGDTLILASGIYTITGAINVSKSIYIRGQGNTATKITCSTADIHVFDITHSTVKISELQIMHSGTGNTYAFHATDGLSSIAIKDVVVIMSGAGVKTCVYSFGSNLTVSDSEFYPTSSNSNSNGIIVANDSDTTINISVNIVRCNFICTGSANNRAVLFYNNNSAKTIGSTIKDCSIVSYPGGSSDYGLALLSVTTNTITVNCNNTLINGADYDIYVTAGNVLNLNGVSLLHNTVSGTVNYLGTGVFGGIDIRGISKFGSSTNYLEIDENGELTLNGTSTVWNDSMIPATAFRTGGTGLTLAQFDGNIWMHRFDVGDIFYVQIQLPHNMKVNTQIEPHLHLAVNSAIGNTSYNVEVTTEEAWANFDAAFESAPVVTSTGLVCSFQNKAQYTHRLLNLANITPGAGQGGISSYVIYRVERITASSQPINPATSVFVLGMDIHYEVDSMGSKTQTAK